MKTRASVRRALRAMACAGWVATSLSATAADPDASARIAELERRLEQSVRMIESLTRKVEQLERAQASVPAGRASGTAGAPVSPPAPAQPAHGGHDAGQLSEGDGVLLRGFADVGYAHSGQSNPLHSGPKGFGLGSFDLYLTPRFGDRIKTLVELLFEFDEGGEMEVDLERMQIGYTFSDAATLWMGRFHTPMGYWNTAFHHGGQLQTSVLRPRFIEFEDMSGVLPTHQVGLWLTGHGRAAGGRFAYDLFVGNGPRISIDPAKPGNVGRLEPNVVRDDNHSAMIGGNVSFAPEGAMRGLRLGAHAMGGDVRDDATPANAARLRVAGPYLVYEDNGWEAIAEAYFFRNRDLLGGTGTHSSHAWFAQLGREFGRWTPFARLERGAFDQGDAYFARQEGGRAYRRAALGLRYDLEAAAALKLEVNRTRIDAIADGLGGTVDDRYGEMRIQYSIRF